MPRKPYARVWNILSRLFSILSPSRSAIAAIAVLILFVSAIPLVVPWLMGRLFDEVIVGGEDLVRRRILAMLVLALLVAETASLIFHSLKDFVTLAFSERLVHRLRLRIFGHLQRVPMEFHDRLRVGALASRILDETRSLEELFKQGIASLFIAPIGFAGMLAIMLRMNPTLTAAALAPAPLLYLAIYLFVRRMRALVNPLKAADEELSARVHENLSSVRTVQLLNCGGAEEERFRELGEKRLALRLRIAQALSRYYPMIGFLTGAGIVATLACGGTLAIFGTLAPGHLVAFIAYLGIFYSLLMELTRANHLLQNVASSGERILEILDTPEGPREKPDARPLPDGPLGVALENVTFAYGNDPVLQGITLALAPGEKLGIVGTTGSGKSTLAMLVPRLYEAVGVRVGGIDVRDFRLADLRKAVAFVGQGDLLFDGTVRTNLSIGCEATDAEMTQALQASEINLSLDLELGERGKRVSEGERQRLCLARAILRRPRIMILDEATSALDVETERRVLEGVLRDGVTAILISHRDQPIDRCDRVVRLEAGRITTTPSAAPSGVPSTQVPS